MERTFDLYISVFATTDRWGDSVQNGRTRKSDGNTVSTYQTPKLPIYVLEVYYRFEIARLPT